MNAKPLFFTLIIVLLPAAIGLGQDSSEKPGKLYFERYRPQFHYTMVKGWINDPIGLVFYKGEYHLFNDHNPFSNRFPGGKTGGEQSHWSHGVTPDLVHWKHLPIAVVPDALGACWSGSGVVDWKNTAGFQTGKEPPLVLIYTSAGKVFGQSLVYSNDRGRTWKKYKGNPIIKQIAGGNRDPRVFWHAPTKKWVMVLYVKRGIAHFFTSDDLKKWTLTAEVPLKGFHECPDLFELAVDGNKKNTKWVLYDARFMYWIGGFDGKTFKPEAGPFRGDLGTNFYAAQTWTNTADRRIQIAWMRGSPYPGMPFNQQSSFPCELSLRTGPAGVRLYRCPVKEIAKLHIAESAVTLSDKPLTDTADKLGGISGDLFDIDMEIEPRKAPEFGIRLHGQTINYAAGQLKALRRSAKVAPIKGAVKLRILVDRTSLELFANDGEVSMTFRILPKEKDTGIELYAKGGEASVKSLKVHKLRSSWKPAPRDAEPKKR